MLPGSETTWCLLDVRERVFICVVKVVFIGEDVLVVGALSAVYVCVCVCVVRVRSSNAGAQ